MNITDERRDPAGALRDALRRNDVERSRRLALTLVRAGEPWSIIGSNGIGVRSDRAPCSTRLLGLGLWAATHVRIAGVEVGPAAITTPMMIAMAANIALAAAGDEPHESITRAAHMMVEANGDTLDMYKAASSIPIAPLHADGQHDHAADALRAIGFFSDWREGVAAGLLFSCTALAPSPGAITMWVDGAGSVTTNDLDAVDQQWRNVVGPMIVAALLEQPWEVTS